MRTANYSLRFSFDPLGLALFVLMPPRAWFYIVPMLPLHPTAPIFFFAFFLLPLAVEAFSPLTRITELLSSATPVSRVTLCLFCDPAIAIRAAFHPALFPPSPDHAARNETTVSFSMTLA